MLTLYLLAGRVRPQDWGGATVAIRSAGSIFDAGCYLYVYICNVMYLYCIVMYGMVVFLVLCRRFQC